MKALAYDAIGRRSVFNLIVLEYQILLVRNYEITHSRYRILILDIVGKTRQNRLFLFPQTDTLNITGGIIPGKEF
jgi:hypothetical protein